MYLAEWTVCVCLSGVVMLCRCLVFCVIAKEPVCGVSWGIMPLLACVFCFELIGTDCEKAFRLVRQMVVLSRGQGDVVRLKSQKQGSSDFPFWTGNEESQWYSGLIFVSFFVGDFAITALSCANSA